MAELTLGGQTWPIAPFRLRELRKAAPFIDRLGARAGQPPSVEAVAETAADMLAVLAVGIEAATAEGLQAQASLSDLDALRAAFEQVMAEAGLKRPEDTPPGEPQGTVPPVPLAERLDALLAELVAAGCGDWDRIEQTWPLSRCHALQAHWRCCGPPAHVSLAALAGFRPPAPTERVDDPEVLARRLRAMGVLG